MIAPLTGPAGEHPGPHLNITDLDDPAAAWLVDAGAGTLAGFAVAPNVAGHPHHPHVAAAVHQLAARADAAAMTPLGRPQSMLIEVDDPELPGILADLTAAVGADPDEVATQLATLPDAALIMVRLAVLPGHSTPGTYTPANVRPAR